MVSSEHPNPSHRARARRRGAAAAFTFTMAAFLGACGGISANEPPHGGGDAGNEPEPRNDAGRPEVAVKPPPIDAGMDSEPPPFNDTVCSEASAATPAMHECDPFGANGGGCPEGEGCYPYAETHGGCAPPEAGSICIPSGGGSQGDPCGGADDCLPGHVCVVSGSGNQCVQICPVDAVAPCPRGFVCHDLDVKGYGGCL